MKNNKINPGMIGLFVLLAMGAMTIAILYYSSDLFSHDKQTFNIMFRTNTSGLDLGAPVVLQGVKIGEVKNSVVGFNQRMNQFEVQVGIVIDRNKVRWPEEVSKSNNENLRDLLIKKGLRAKLAMHSLVTGKLMVQIDFYPDTELILAGLENEIPSTPSISLSKLMEDIAHLDIKQINSRIEKVMSGLDKIINDGKIQIIEDELIGNLKDLQVIVSVLSDRIVPLTDNLNNTLVDTKHLVNKIDSKVEAVSQSVTYAGNEVGDLSKLLRKDIIPVMNQLIRVTEEAESMIKKGSPLRVELLNALRNINKASLSLYEFANYLERHPEALLKGKK